MEISTEFCRAINTQFYFSYLLRASLLCCVGYKLALPRISSVVLPNVVLLLHSSIFSTQQRSGLLWSLSHEQELFTSWMPIPYLLTISEPKLSKTQAECKHESRAYCMQQCGQKCYQLRRICGDDIKVTIFVLLVHRLLVQLYNALELLQEYCNINSLTTSANERLLTRTTNR